ncbi:MAG: phenylalanine--tRNA ligase subunit alpha [Chloroflexota bacterium]|nr:phenylalanine--tRNA ligase subunit alpha [Chloroflexota bacterium]
MTTAPEILGTLHNIRTVAVAELDGVEDDAALEAWRIAYLGRREGRLTLIMRRMAELEAEERRSVGVQANDVKALLESQLAEKTEALKSAKLAQAAQEGRLDVTLPGRRPALGRLHPITQTMREITRAFISMGFQVVEGPEVELDHYNFGMLNIPRGHPARDMFDTLWLDHTNAEGEREMLLRTHTSPMQARIMEATQPPVRVVVPGRVYRFEATDATHEWHFTQVEGLAVDRGITFANLKGTLYEFARLVFGSERRVRFRCDFFPFVEPGVDVAIDCFSCDGAGAPDCRICRGSGWIEIMGAGMVHPRVLEMSGIDHTEYTGFAFGMGVERIAMLKHGIDDIRYFYGNDARFLRQF